MDTELYLLTLFSGFATLAKALLDNNDDRGICLTRRAVDLVAKGRSMVVGGLDGDDGWILKAGV